MFSFKRNFATIIFIIFFIFLLFPFTPPQAESQQQDHVNYQLTLDQPASSVLDGDQITFTGRYSNISNGAGMGDYYITIRDWDGTCFLLCTDDFLAGGNTDQNGYFSITWTAYCEDNENPCSQEIFAQRTTGGGVDIRTQSYDVAIIDPVDPTITTDKEIYYPGDTMLISGTSNANEELEFNIEAPLDANNEITIYTLYATSDSNGEYSLLTLFESNDPVGLWSITVLSDHCANKSPCHRSTTVNLQQIVTPTIFFSPDKSTWYRGEIATIYGTANPNEELVWSVTYPNNTVFVWSDIAPVITDSDGYYQIDNWLWHESELINSYGIYTFTIYSPKCDCSADTSVELIEEPVVTPTISLDKSTWYRGELAIVSGTANPNEELVFSVTYPNNTVFVWSDIVPVITDSDGDYQTGWIWAESELLEPYGTYTFTIYSPKCDCSAETTVELIPEPVELTTTLTFDSIPSSAISQQEIVFSGRLIRTDTGDGINNALISIIDQDTGFLSTNDTLVTGYTNNSGYFSIPWTAYCEDNESPDCSQEIFAEFSGNDEFPKSNTPIYNLAIVSKTSTSITLDQPPSPVTEGETVTFTGRLTRLDTGAGITGQTIYIYDCDINLNDCSGSSQDDLIGTGTTDSNGYFSIAWVAADIDTQDDIMETYAYYSGTDELESSVSSYYNVEVITQPESTLIETILTLDIPPSTVDEGDVVTFTGRLTRTDTGNGISGQAIYIYDWDGVEEDDLLASGRTDSNGYFSIEWIAEDVDINDNKMETYAYYLGSDNYEPSSAPANLLRYHSVEVIPAKIITTITLSEIPNSALEGTLVSFSGRLIENAISTPIPDQLVYLVEYTSPGLFDDDDTILWSGYTDENGYFYGEWEVTCIDKDEQVCEVELYSYYDGNDEFERSYLLPLYMTLLVEETIATLLTFDEPPSTVNEGDEVTFTGRITRSDNGEGISGQTINIYDYDGGPFNGELDDLLAVGVTDSNGYFNIVWIAKDLDIIDDNIESYTYFAGTSEFSSTTSPYYYEIEIILRDNSPPLVSVDHSPSQPRDSDTVTFTVFVDDDFGNEGFSEVRLILDGEIVQTWNSLGNHEITLGPFNEGEHSYYVIAEDKEGNWNSDPADGSKTFFVTKEPEKIKSVMSLDKPISIVDEGDNVRFTGNLAGEDGNPISGVLVSIRDEDLGEIKDDILGSGLTDVNGNFEIDWIAKCVDEESSPCVLEIFSLFHGSQTHSGIISPQPWLPKYNLEINTDSVSIRGFAICEGKHCEEHVQDIQNAKVVLVSDNGKCYDDPTNSCFDSLLTPGIKLNPTSYSTFTDDNGEFVFHEVQITSSSGVPNTFFVTVSLQHESFVTVMSGKEGSTTAFSKSVGPMFFSNDDDFFVLVKFSSTEEVNAAAIYAYTVRIFDYFIDEVDYSELDDYPNLRIYLGSHIPGSEKFSGLWKPLLGFGVDECWAVAPPLFCYVSILEAAHPSNNEHSWKDTVGMEVIHALHTTNSRVFVDMTKMNVWWIENMGTFFAEALQHELNDSKGAQNGVVGRFGTCSTTVNNLDHFTRDKNKNGKWSDYNGYRDPTAWISLQIPGYKTTGLAFTALQHQSCGISTTIHQ